MRNLVLVSIGLACLVAGSSHAGVLAEHSGSADPATELGLAASGDTGNGWAVDDGGVAAWAIVDNSTSPLTYQHAMTASELADAAAYGWSVTASLKLLDVNKPYNDSVMIYARINDLRHVVQFSTDDAAVPTVRIHGSNGWVNEYTVGSAGYHEYKLIYDPVSDSSDFFVDGIERLTNIPIDHDDGTNYVYFGSALAGDTGQGAYYSAFELATIPEPLTAAFLALGGLALVRKRS
ncbi:MAG: hypothetical protein GXY55_21975 [Phycisphaerae bacterium]|nr:hypothetical protein [Phycisphaerae bacterium]